jgi:GDP-L-fucose synthase
MKIVVLGGHGFLGQHVCRVLKAHSSYDVIPFSRRDGLDLLEFDTVARVLQRFAPEAIVNCAAHVGGVHYVASVPADVTHDNVTMALHLYRAVARHCPTAHIVNPLSNCSYPGGQQLFREHAWLSGDVHPSVYSYGHAKRMLYVLATCYKQQYGIRSTHLLIPNAFGPGDRTEPHLVHALNGMIIRMLHAWKHNEPTFEVWGSGRPMREWVYIEDVAAILKAVLDRGAVYSEPINIAQQQGYTIQESATMIAQAIGYEGEILCNPYYPDGDAQKLMHAGRFRQSFPHFQFADHFTAICQTVAYYKTLLFVDPHPSRTAA